VCSEHYAACLPFQYQQLEDIEEFILKPRKKVSLNRDAKFASWKRIDFSSLDKVSLEQEVGI
jgi:hypothetical protein